MQRAGPDLPLRGVRASDAERDRCTEVLRDAYAEGRVSLEELEERLARTRDAGTRLELRRLTRDVPHDHARRAARADHLDRAALTVHATVFTGLQVVRAITAVQGIAPGAPRARCSRPSFPAACRLGRFPRRSRTP